MGDNGQLKKDTIRGLFWTFADFFSSRGIGFIIQLLLARLLLPVHFGLMGMILIVIAVSQTIVDSGMQNALIREKDSTQEDYSTVFYFNLVISFLLYSVIFGIAPYVSLFYDEPILTALLRVLGIIVIINAFSIVQRTILTKNIDFKTQTIINIISTFFSGIISIGLAFYGFGVWSLVIQNVVGQLLQSILLTVHNRWLPSLIFSVASFKRLFGFGWKLLISSLIDTSYQNFYNVIIGRTYSTIPLGYYTQALMLRDVASKSITSAVQKVTYPVLSKMQENEEQLKRGYRTLIKSSVFITFPVMIGLSAISGTLIPLLFGEKWAGTVPFFQILCLAGMLYPLQSINLNILQVKGRSDLFLKLEIIKKTFGISLITITIVLKLGMFVLVWTLVISAVISYFINSYYSGKLLNYSTKQQIKDITKTMISTLIMGISVIMLGSQLDMLNNLFSLILQIMLGFSVFVGMSLILKSNELNYFIKTLKTLLNKKVKNQTEIEKVSNNQ
ncbi:lipopolysaccharide biosynthesis protein [Ammoniphilus oxalaticus]|uniref:Lipopolysaccharide biosynthesis protein n=1 Tax=Ammoniphilus oxalaticus TaxID=66863 RepID=A0A419SH23_9BACL|nr:lipopolysaccharide biosynthesis protein [Ammoniphilus oxalaticus]RKD23111.1 lipopolysaccharide biosynthesis protein [Ammoniphilus oxalaticus]